MDTTVYILLDELYSRIRAEEDCASALSRQIEWLRGQGCREAVLIDARDADTDVTEKLGQKLALRAYIGKDAFAAALEDAESAHCVMIQAGFPFGMELSCFFEQCARCADGLLLALRYSEEKTPDTRYVFWGSSVIEFMMRENCSEERYVYGGLCAGTRAFFLENVPQANLDTEYFRQVFDVGKLHGFPIPMWNHDPAKISEDAPLPALFLDRDGVLLEDTGYINDPETLVYNDALLEALADCDYLRKGAAIVIVSNQAGIAKGLVTREEAEAVNARVCAHMQEIGLAVDGVWYCPYHEDGEIPELSRGSLRRKPSPGMLLLAAEALHLDLARSLMAGDSESDRIALPYLETFLFSDEFPYAHEQKGGIADLLQTIARKFGGEAELNDQAAENG
ncbi:MAG: HAD-IIIA family hydrolase [Spirochaetota bacterium]|jgi:histidinol-phosphate phosphatase family protein|nr:HAD-IIIA family hydrolase [Spirochaetota bacterium]